MRRALVVLTGTVIALVMVTAAEAFLPQSVENALRQMFDSTSHFIGFTIYPRRNIPNGKLGTCELYVDKDTGSLVASCNQQYPKFIVNTSPNACTEDATGALSCRGFISANQNTLFPDWTANRWRMYANTINLTPDPTCANMGQGGTATILDIDESEGTNTFVMCNGTTEGMPLSSAIPDCPLAGAGHLTYNASTHAFGCD